MFELDARRHRRFVGRALRLLIGEGSFASKVYKGIGRELHDQFVDYPDLDEGGLSRESPVEALFDSLVGGWSLDPEWLADEGGRYSSDDGAPLPVETKPAYSAVEQLAAYGLRLIADEFDSLGSVPSEGVGDHGFSREQVQQHRAACLLFAQQALIYAQRLSLGTQLSEEEVSRAARAASARRAADARHAADPKQAAKASVYECWQKWHAEPTRYASAAAFARDMLDKQLDLESETVIARWVRRWSKGAE